MMKLRNQIFLGTCMLISSFMMIESTSANEIADFEARLEQLEKQNQELQDLLRETLGREQAAESASPAEMFPPEKELWIEPVVVPSPPNDNPFEMTARWRDGLELQTRDKNFRVHVGGRVHVDGVWIQDDEDAFMGAGGVGGADAMDIRRARLRVDGTMYEFMDWVVEFDFANNLNDNIGVQSADERNVINVPAPTSLFMNFGDVPWVGNFRVGYFKEPIGLEHMMSSTALSFMERSFNQDAFTGAFNNGFSTGIMIWDTFDEDHGTWATGFFRNTSNIFAYGVGDGEYAWTTRVTYLPLFQDDGRELIHVGASGSLRGTNNGIVHYRSRGSLRNGPGSLNPALVNTGAFEADDQNMLGVELAAQYHRVMFMSEYMSSWSTSSVGNGISAPLGQFLGTTRVDGWYVEMTYFLTDDYRPYDKRNGMFGRVRPSSNFDWKGGTGAWEVGARYARLSLQDGLLDGGRLQDLTLGLNWYLNPNVKFMVNYAYTDRIGTMSAHGGDYHGAGVRMMYDF